MLHQTELGLDRHRKFQQTALKGLGEPQLKRDRLVLAESELPIPEDGGVRACGLHVAIPATGLDHRERRGLSAALRCALEQWEGVWVGDWHWGDARESHLSSALPPQETPCLS